MEMQKLPEDFFDDEFEERKPRPRWQIAVAALAIIGLLYLSGVYHTLFLRRTPPDLVQEEIVNNFVDNQINILVDVFVFGGQTQYASTRDENNIRDLFEDADEIWGQAGINLEVRKISGLDLTYEEIQQFLRHPSVFITNITGYDSSVVTIVLPKVLPGINGIAFTNINSGSVADFTSIRDFRTLAHEVGHILKLGHVVNRAQLMSSGTNGVKLSDEEIEIARNSAQKF